MTAIRIADEELHEVPTDDEHWQESVYLAWRDKRTGISGIHRLGNEANRFPAGRAVLWSAVFTDDGLLYRTNDDSAPLPDGPGPGVGAGTHRLFHDGESLRYVAHDQGLVVDLRLFDVLGDGPGPTDETASYNGGSSENQGSFFSHHFEAHDRVVGTVRIGDLTWDIDAAGWRDHSWGLRRWQDHWGCRFFNGGDGTLDNTYKYLSVIPPNGHARKSFSLTVGGAPLDVVDAEMMAHVADDWMQVRAADIRYHLADGSVRTVHYTAAGGHIALGGVVSWESVGDVTLDGEPIGWGMLEAVANHRGSTNPPVHVVGDVMTNGLSGRQR